MSKTIKVALAGAGAFGIKHLDGIKNIDGVEVVSLISRELEKTKEVASKYGIKHVTTKLEDSLALPEVDAVILCTPTQMHAAQSIACLKAGKHVQVEIPLADSWKDAEAVVALAKEKGNLRFLLNYTKSGCEYECGLDRAAKKCSCIPWNLPRMPGTNITKPFLLLSAKF